MFGAAFFAVFFTADTCTYTRREAMDRHASLAILQFLIFNVCYITHLFLDPRLQLHEVHPELQCTRLQGAGREEGILSFQTSWTFKVY